MNGAIIPPGMPLPCRGGPSILSVATRAIMHETRPSDDGIGSPSKYEDLPVASLGIRATVALNLASRVRPQQMKVVRMKISPVLRSPMVKARKAGATPKEICNRHAWSCRQYQSQSHEALCQVGIIGLQNSSQLTRSAKLSSSCPSMLLSFLHRATLPSIRSKIAPRMGITKPILLPNEHSIRGRSMPEIVHLKLRKGILTIGTLDYW